MRTATITLLSLQIYIIIITFLVQPQTSIYYTRLLTTVFNKVIFNVR